MSTTTTGRAKSVKKSKKQNGSATHALAGAGKGETAAVRRALDLVDEILRKKAQVGMLFFEIGLALVELEKKALWKALGHASFAAMLGDRGLMARSQAFKLMAIARELPQRVALALGTEKSYALVRYAHATAAADTPASLLSTGVVVIGGERRTVDVTSASDIRREAARILRNRRNARKSPERKSARELALLGQGALSKTLGERVKVAAKQVSKGWIVTIEMSVGALEELRRHLAK
jgi:hypothetical protein